MTRSVSPPLARALALGLVALLAACAKTGPAPVVEDLIDGVVTTREQVLVPLERHGDETATRLLLVPTGEANPDPALGPVTTASRRRAVGTATYSMGFAPEVVLAPSDPVGTYFGNTSASLNKVSLSGYVSGLEADAMAERLRGEFAGLRVVLVGEPAWLEAVAESLAGDDVVDWPTQGDEAIVYVVAGGQGAPAAQAFGVDTRPE